MKKELLALLAKLTGLLTTKKEGSDDDVISDEAQAVIDGIQSQIDEAGNQEERVTELEGNVATLEGSVTTVTEERDVAQASLATANTTIGTLQTDLVKAKAASTKAPGKQGAEDSDKPVDAENATLAADAKSIMNRFNQTSD